MSGIGSAQRLLVVRDRRAEALDDRVAQADGLIGVEIRAALERRKHRPVQDLVDPGTPDPGDHVLVAQQRVERPGLVEQLLERRRVGPRLRSELGQNLLLREVLGAQDLDPGPLLGAELAQPQLTAVLEPDEKTRRAVAQRGARVEQLQTAGRHQVHEQRQTIVGPDGEQLAAAPGAGQRAPDDRLERRVKRLQGIDAGGQNRLDARASDRASDQTRSDLNFR